MEVRLLGELEALEGGAPRPIRGTKQRTLLAVLALHRGRAVSSDRLIDTLWGDAAPTNPTNALQAQIAQLRRSLGGEAIITSDAGYALNVAPENIDAVRFERMVDDARHLAAGGQLREASTAFADALALCHGDPLAEFAYAGFADAERTRLEEFTVAAIEDRLDTDLALGRHRELVSDLETLCRQHPLRERLWASLMLALYRSGRQAEALRAYAEAREQLVEELGLEPGEALRDLEARILAQDPSLSPFDAAPAPPPTPGNLRERASSFVGRERELDQVVTALESSRLVTLIGPGGVGKTRLAIEVAESFRARHADGAWLVELAGVPDEQGVAAATAGVLMAGQVGAASDRAASPEERIVDHVRGRSMLIILDNCEHVIGAAATLAERLVGATQRLRVIATSREALGVPGETLVPLRGLDPGSAVDLFADRATAAQPRFELDGSVRPVVEDICNRLDGLPLAIELAAARLRALPVATLSARLDDRFRLLTGGSRTALPRHQTLRAVVDWSYDLLFEDERLLFDRLSVFVGGCDLEAAEGVCADHQLQADQLIDVLGRLIDKSLVTADVSGPDSARYSQLQTLWQYGRERLAASNEARPVRDRHAQWFLQLADEARIGLRGRGAPEWRKRVEADLGNLRAALEWFLEQNDADSALTLVYGVAGWLSFIRADSGEAVRWIEEALALAAPASPGLRGVVASWHALHMANIKGPVAAIAEAKEAVDELRLSDEPILLAEGLILLSEIYNRLGEFDAALEALADARPLIGDEEWVIAVHDVLAAGNYGGLGRFDEAERLARAGVDRYRSVGEPWAIIEGLGLLAGIEEARGGLAAAAAAYEELVETATNVGLTHYETLWRTRLGAIRARMGDNLAAGQLFAEALSMSQRPVYTSTALIGQAGAARRLGDLDSCRRWLDEAGAISEAIEFPPGVAASLIGLAWWALSTGDHRLAQEYAGRACECADGANDAILRLSANTAAAAVALCEADTDTNRSRLRALLEQRATTGAARFARILGGAFGAALDEPDVAALAAAYGLDGLGAPVL